MGQNGSQGNLQVRFFLIAFHMKLYDQSSPEFIEKSVVDIVLYVLLMMWLRLGSSSELESDLRDTVGWGNGFLISKLEKVNLFHLTLGITMMLLMWSG